jgi:hypothetical protein
MSTHGPQHDEFRSQVADTHGGATYDEGFGGYPAAHSNAHGKLFDKFSERPGVDRYGERWDNFPWKDVPSLHGQHYDEGFDSPSFEGGEHGQLHDVFRGARVRYMYGGRDVEGIVLQTGREFATVESREGDRHEVMLTQVLQYANQGQPSNPEGRTAEPATVDTSVVSQKPSAPANGGERVDGGSYDDSVVTHVKSFAETLEVVKSLDRPFDEAEFDRDAQALADVAKSNPGNPGVAHLSTKKLTEAHAKFSDHYTAARLTGNHERAHFAANVLASVHHELATRGVMAEKPDEGALPVTRGLSSGHQPLRNKSATDADDVTKDVDSEETAIQGEGGGPAANWCKTCQHYCRKVTAGKCPTCGNAVGVKKDWTESLDVLKKMRSPAAPHMMVGSFKCSNCGHEKYHRGNEFKGGNKDDTARYCADCGDKEKTD